MDGSIALWLLTFACLFATLVIVCLKQGPQRALGVAVGLSFLLPTWLVLEVAGLPFNLRTAISIAGLLLYCVHPAAKIFDKLTLLDCAVTLLVLINVISDVRHGGSAPLVLMRTYGEWAIPYIAGRYALRSRHDIKFLAPVIAAVATVLALMSVVETFSGYNPFELVYGARPRDGVARDASRWGWKRSFGTTHHPIYFGALLMLLVPWSVQFTALGRSVAGRSTRAMSLLTMFLGTLATISRSTAAAFLLIIPPAVAFRSRQMFMVTAAFGFLAVMLGLTQLEKLSELTHKAGEEVPTKGWQIELDGERVSWTGTNNRIMLLKVYAPIIRRLHPLGAGTEATASFPPNIPYLPDVAESMYAMRMVDNAFILIGLRFGWVGMCVFASMLMIGIWQFLSVRQRSETQLFATTSAAMLVSLGLLMCTVWMNYDFGFVYLWTLGISSALVCEPARRDPHAERHPRRRRRSRPSRSDWDCRRAIHPPAHQVRGPRPEGPRPRRPLQS